MTPQEQLEAMQAYFTEIRERFAALEEKIIVIQDKLDALGRLDAQLENAKRKILEAESRYAAWQG